MSLVLNQAKNVNWRASILTGYDVDISDYIQSIAMPNISFQEVESSYKNRTGKLYAETPMYDSIDVTLIIDENFKILENIYKWAFDLSEESHSKLYGSVKVGLLDSYQNIKAEITFNSVIVTNISGFELSVTDNMPLHLTVTLSFSSMEYEFYNL